MKRVAICLAVIGSCFAYEMNPQLYQGMWVVMQETKDTKTVRVSGDTVVGLDTLQLDEGHQLTIEQVDGGSIHFIIDDEETIINGNIQTNCPLEIATKGVLLLDGHICVPGGEICIKAKQLQITERGKVETTASKGGTISIEADQLLHKDGAIMASAGETDAGCIYIVTKEAPKLFGLTTVEAKQGHGGIINICCDSGRPVWSNLNLEGAQGVGQLILDPKNVLIQAGGADSATGNTFASDPTGDVVIDGATLATAIDSAAVTIQANTDITLADNITATTSGNGLTLQAGRSITFQKNCALTLNNANFSATINDEGAQSDNRDAGTAIYTMVRDSRIDTQGGDITIAVGTFGSSQNGQANLKSATLDAGGGMISITGMNAVDTNSPGIALTTTDMTTTGLGTVTLAGTGSDVGAACYGVCINKCTVTAEDGMVQITGIGGGSANTGNTFNYGMVITSGEVSTSGSGNIDLVGTGGNGENRNHAIIIGSGALIQTLDGAMTATTTGGGTLDHNYGFRIEGGSIFEATGAGTIFIDGNGGGTDQFNIGLSITSKDTKISVVNGTMTLDGTGGGGTSNNSGIAIDGSALISSTGTGTITMTGESVSGGTNRNMGILCGGKQTSITSQDANISLTGTAHGSEELNEGIRLESEFTITATGLADITINGTGGLGAKANNGFEIDSNGSISAFDGDVDCTGTALATDTLGIFPPSPINITSTNGTVTLTSNDG